MGKRITQAAAGNLKLQSNEEDRKRKNNSDSHEGDEEGPKRKGWKRQDKSRKGKGPERKGRKRKNNSQKGDQEGPERKDERSLLHAS
jgi:hypothetical protein